MGDQALWRILAIQSHGTFDLLQAADSRFRGQRFKLFGVISDPDCKKATGPINSGCGWMTVPVRMLQRLPTYPASPPELSACASFATRIQAFGMGPSKVHGRSGQGRSRPT